MKQEGGKREKAEAHHVPATKGKKTEKEEENQNLQTTFWSKAKYFKGDHVKPSNALSHVQH
ncbi:CLUMA_CG009579, isoform A [Clunio marinus]|uniref:CLUMA_CG009579, isoform A n=1 Tax=Clunio marinus TaxID=568069 RepID=A0A1J1IB05_9DIPT|nr:CLUMA_CG009579, isoform A [Clunio marinus]